MGAMHPMGISIAFTKCCWNGLCILSVGLTYNSVKMKLAILCLCLASTVSAAPVSLTDRQLQWLYVLWNLSQIKTTFYPILVNHVWQSVWIFLTLYVVLLSLSTSLWRLQTIRTIHSGERAYCKMFNHACLQVFISYMLNCIPVRKRKSAFHPRQPIKW